MDHKGVIYPGDLGPNEETALQHVIRHGTTDIVMYLARFWGEHLYSGSFDDTWFFQANRLLEDSSMPSERKYALSSMVSRTEDEIDAQETPLHSAVRRADFGEMQQAAKSQPWTMSQLDYCGKTPLHVAASLGNVDAARELLKAGCNVNQRDAVGDTALMTALKTGHVVLAQFLIDTGCMVDAQSKAGVAALHCASHLSTGTALTDAMGSLLSAGATPTIANVDGVTVLHTLIWSDADKDTFKAGLRMLLSAGVDLEARDCLGRTALADAVEWDRPVALECFVEAGANAATVRPHGNILHSAAGSAGYEVLSYLESLSLSGINLDHINEDGNTVWDSFIWVSYAEDWRIANCRRPSPEEEQAFVRVYRGVRDRSLASDVKTLQRVREHAAHKDRRAATAALAPLIKQKEEWGRGDLAETYKTIRLQIREGMWDAAVESVDENVGLLQEEMATSPWEKPSRHDSLRYEDSDETAIESEYELETTTVHSTGDEEEATEIEGDEEEEEEEEEEE
ncbi:pfs domain-containing protein [Colletotrichum falcatum]|nr:pfs domain-containing protein [Colletotrichum falcatum]